MTIKRREFLGSMAAGSAILTMPAFLQAARARYAGLDVEWVEDGLPALEGVDVADGHLRAWERGVRGEPIPVRDIMKPDPITVPPETPTLAAINLMRKHRVSCLPVVSRDKLVGILTERDLIEVAAKLLEDQLRGLHGA